MPEEIRILELFSGIGGMHSAFKLSEVPGEIVAAVDINQVANAVYQHNHPKTTLFNNNIQKFTPKKINNLNVNTILMSPPCQPFCRVGNQKDVDDARTDAFVYICENLPLLTTIKSILMENVKGFETSKARDLFTEALQKCGFHYQEFILSPTQVGVPNTRHRYYCLARKSNEFSFKTDGLLETLPSQDSDVAGTSLVKDFIEESNEESLLPDNVLEKRSKILDIVCPGSTNTICFTKAYTHYTEGTGSVFCPFEKSVVSAAYDRSMLALDKSESLEIIKKLKLRYFTPLEVAKLMSFPTETFSFPKTTTNRQKYRLLGNSINVLLVSELIKLLFS